MADEKRLIDANALDNKLETLKIRFKALGRDNVVDDYNFVQTVLLTAPTVDAVEVVRCKDCKHREHVWCPMESVEQYPWLSTKDDDFCSYGERKDNGAV